VDSQVQTMEKVARLRLERPHHLHLGQEWQDSIAVDQALD
jgi:hypothetical protein